jgi:hypothetical protein
MNTSVPVRQCTIVLPSACLPLCVSEATPPPHSVPIQCTALPENSRVVCHAHASVRRQGGKGEHSQHTHRKAGPSSCYSLSCSFARYLGPYVHHHATAHRAPLPGTWARTSITMLQLIMLLCQVLGSVREGGPLPKPLALALGAQVQAVGAAHFASHVPDSVFLARCLGQALD